MPSRISNAVKSSKTILKGRVQKFWCKEPGLTFGDFMTEDFFRQLQEKPVNMKRANHSPMSTKLSTQGGSDGEEVKSGTVVTVGLPPPKRSKRPKLDDKESNGAGDEGKQEATAADTTVSFVILKQPSNSAQYKRVALDCEMVGVGRHGRRLILARVSLVDHMGHVMLDAYVKPSEVITNYMTEISGIRPEDVEHGVSYRWVRRKVLAILKHKILVGHGLENDMKVLNISHPQELVRDTSKYKPLRVFTPHGRTPSLKNLTKIILGKDIQIGEHDSVEDARSVMFIYNYLAESWEGEAFHDKP